MEPEWQNYTESAGNRAGHFSNGFEGNPSQPQHTGSGRGQTQQHQAPMGYTYESYQPPGAASKVLSSNPAVKSVSMTSSPSSSTTPNTRELLHDVDTPMEDADPYNRSKYPTRSTQHHRSSSQFLASEESSAAARRYSPMNVISPGLPYNPSPTTAQNSYGLPPTGQSSSRPSPASANSFSSPPQSYQSPPCMYLPVPISQDRVAFSLWILIYS